MIAGHFGLAAGVKSISPRTPLWAMMLGTFLLDVIFLPLSALGIESLAPVDPEHAGYGSSLIHAYYTHSFVGAVLIALAAGLLAGKVWGKQSGVTIGGLVFSHWLLDLIVHRPDLPILPGNLGNLPLLGLGLWTMPALSAALELAIVLAGSYLYFARALRLPVPTNGNAGTHRRKVLLSGSVVTVLLVLLLITDVLGV